MLRHRGALCIEGELDIICVAIQNFIGFQPMIILQLQSAQMVDTGCILCYDINQVSSFVHEVPDADMTRVQIQQRICLFLNALKFFG